LFISSYAPNTPEVGYAVDNKNLTQASAEPRSGILGPEEARSLQAAGWSSADLHVHTLHSYDVIPTRLVDPLTLYQKARRLGMTFVAFTDHDTMAAYDQIGWTRDGLVPAVEAKILDPVRVGHTVHINIYTLDREQYAEIRKIIDKSRDIELLTSYLREERLPFIFNHPFWHEMGEEPNLRAVFEIAGLFPVLEYNMGRINRINQLAYRLTEEKSKGIVAATDSHIGWIGRAFTLARGGTFREYFNEIANRRSFIMPSDLTLRGLKEETAVRIRHLFDKAGWLHPKESLAIDTGNAVLDRIISRMARERTDSPGISLWLLRKVIETLSNSGIPGSLYLRYQENLADRIGRLLGSANAAS
jgi:hypothetical protein